LKYDKSGVCSSNHYDWKELKPFKREENHSWGKRYLLELCCLCTGKFRLFGDHTWVRLKTPEGDVYAPGLYRENNRIREGWRVQQGRIQNPDISEFWPEKIRTIGFEIDARAFLRIKGQIEEDHVSEIPFHVFRKNCTEYALGLAQLAGINIPTKESFVFHFIPEKIHRASSRLIVALPRPLQLGVQKVLDLDHYLCCIGLNIAQAILGGTKVSLSFSSEKREELKPHIASVSDIFRSSKLECRSPYTLAFSLWREIQSLRKQEAERRKVDVKELQYWVPDCY